MLLSTQFPPTPWTLLSKAVDLNQSAEREIALDCLCRYYWYPLYAFARWKKLSHEDAQDQTQIFLARLIERNSLENADSSRGRLRSYLLSAFQNQLINQWQHDQAERRGSKFELVSLDMIGAENRFDEERCDSSSDPSNKFDRAWALALLDACLADMATTCKSEGSDAEFELLRPFLSPLNVSDADMISVAGQLGLTSVAVRQRVSRLRMKFSKLLRRHVAGSLSDPTPEAVEEEMRCLRDALVHL